MIRKTLGLVAIFGAIITSAVAQEFPVTIEHKFGTTTLEEQPARVASIDYGGIGNLLALGIQPLTVREWRKMDGFKFTAGPWAAPLLTSTPVVLDGSLDFEAIASTNPDVIIALYSGIDDAEYKRLSLIAPVIAVPAGIGDYALPWQDRARIKARALGKEEIAQAQITTIEQKLAKIRADHPEWAGMTAVLGSISDGKPSAYSNHDGRANFIYEMGFTDTPSMREITEPDQFWLDLSAEQLQVIDADIVAYYVTDDAVQPTLDEPGRKFLRASKTGGEIFLGDTLVAALARVSLISIPVALDGLVPLLEAAADGDPATIVNDARH